MYTHKVQYYETDKMGITHHSNYIRWMEEARVDFLDKMGYGFDRLEAEGIVSPVISVECEYDKVTRFPEEITIDVQVEEFRGVKLKLVYTMTNAAGDVVCRGKSGHCFLDTNGRPMRLNKSNPEFYELLRSYVKVPEN